MNRYQFGWTWDEDTYTWRCHRCGHEVSREAAREYGLRKLHRHTPGNVPRAPDDGIDWRPYTEHAPDGEALWLRTQSGAIFTGKWGASGFRAPQLPLGVQITHWARPVWAADGSPHIPTAHRPNTIHNPEEVSYGQTNRSNDPS